MFLNLYQYAPFLSTYANAQFCYVKLLAKISATFSYLFAHFISFFVAITCALLILAGVLILTTQFPFFFKHNHLVLNNAFVLKIQCVYSVRLTSQCPETTFVVTWCYVN